MYRWMEEGTDGGRMEVRGGKGVRKRGSLTDRRKEERKGGMKKGGQKDGWIDG